MSGIKPFSSNQKPFHLNPVDKKPASFAEKPITLENKTNNSFSKTPTQLFLTTAAHHFERGNYKRVISLAERGLENNPSPDKRAFFQEKIIAAKNKEASLHEERASHFLSTGDSSAAIKEANAGLELEPDDKDLRTKLRLALGKGFLNTKDFDNAILITKNEVEGNPNPIFLGKLFSMLSACYAKKLDYTWASHYAQEALKTNPTPEHRIAIVNMINICKKVKMEITGGTKRHRIETEKNEFPPQKKARTITKE